MNIKKSNVNQRIKKANGLVVLSLFDGMSCGHLALDKAGIKINTYIASEVKSFAIEHTNKKYKETILAGDVTKLHYENNKLYRNCSRWVIVKDIDVLSKEDKERNINLIKFDGKYTLIDIVNCVFDNNFDKNNIKLANYKEDGLLVNASTLSNDELENYKKDGFIDLPNQEIVKWETTEPPIYEGSIDMLIGGSPCQDFSAANAPNGRKYGLEGPKSRLFFDYLRLKKEVNPTFFFLENVKMKKNSEETLSSYMGVNGIHINSNLITIQQRDRIYWTNINNGIIEQPKLRKGNSANFQDYKLKTLPHIENMLYIKKYPMCFELFSKEVQETLEEYIVRDCNGNIISFNEFISDEDITKICNIESNKWARKELDKIRIANKKKFPNEQKYKHPLTDREFVEQLHAIIKESLVKKTPSRDKMWNEGNPAKFACKNITNADKMSCLTRKQDRFPNSGLISFGPYCRFVNSLEICKGQTVPYDFLNDLTYTQIQDVCGDGWTVDVIAHIFKYLKKSYEF